MMVRCFAFAATVLLSADEASCMRHGAVVGYAMPPLAGSNHWPVRSSAAVMSALPRNLQEMVGQLKEAVQASLSGSACAANTPR